MAGTGVDTPRALASFASRWGGSGARGGAQEGDTADSGWSASSDKEAGILWS